MSINMLDVRMSKGDYKVTTASGAEYTLRLLDGETNVVGAHGGSLNLEECLYVLEEGAVTVGRPMTLKGSPLLGLRSIETSAVASIEFI